MLQRTGPKMLDHEGKSLPGNRGYKYDCACVCVCACACVCMECSFFLSGTLVLPETCLE